MGKLFTARSLLVISPDQLILNGVGIDLNHMLDLYPIMVLGEYIPDLHHARRAGCGNGGCPADQDIPRLGSVFPVPIFWNLDAV